MSVRQPVSLKGRPVMGDHATDVNGQVLLQLSTGDAREAQGWLPGGRLHTDLLALLHVYLGSRLDVRMQLCVDRALLPDAQICCCTAPDSPQLGRTAILKPLAAGASQSPRPIIISLGRYQRVQENHQRKETHEDGDYRW